MTNAQGVSTYLLTVDPATLIVLWANERVEQAIHVRTGTSAVGQSVNDVIYLGKEVGVLDRIKEVAETGEPHHIGTHTFSVTGEGSTSLGSFYLLPTGQVLVAAEWIKDADRPSSDLAV